ncbi:MAG: DUF4347 domain-containing protein, partial [Cyanobacteriota bacterium]
MTNATQAFGLLKQRREGAKSSSEDDPYGSGSSEEAGETLLLIDGSLPEVGSLLAGLAAGVRSVVVQPDEDALTRLLAAMPLQGGVRRLAVVAHGRPGEVLIGSEALTQTTLATRADEWVALASSSIEAIDLFACHTGLDHGFVQALAAISGCGVAASSRPVGHGQLGGDWGLDLVVRPSIGLPTLATNGLVPFTRSARKSWRQRLVPTTYYVGTPTSGSGDGTQSNPWNQSMLDWASNAGRLQNDTTVVINQDANVRIRAGVIGGAQYTGPGTLTVYDYVDQYLTKLAPGTLNIEAGFIASIWTGKLPPALNSFKVGTSVEFYENTAGLPLFGVGGSKIDLNNGSVQLMGWKGESINNAQGAAKDIIVRFGNYTITDLTPISKATELWVSYGNVSSTVPLSQLPNLSGNGRGIMVYQGSNLSLTADDAVALSGNPNVASTVKLAAQGGQQGAVVTIRDYTNQDLATLNTQSAPVLSQWYLNFNVVTADGAQLDSSKLQKAQAITIGAGTATIDAAATDEVAVASKTKVAAGGTLAVTNYLNTDLSPLTNTGGSIRISTADGAVLNAAKLADATAITIAAGAATSPAGLLNSLGVSNVSVSPGASLTIQDTTAALAATSSAILNLATTLAVDTPLTVAGVSSLSAIGRTVTYSLSDTASTLAQASAGVLNNAFNITSTGTATPAETGILLAAQNTGSTTISAASMTSAEALVLSFNGTGDDRIVSLSISDPVDVAQATALQILRSNAEVTTLKIAALNDIADNIAGISADVLASVGGTGTVTANGYTSQDLSNVVTPTLQVNTADGAQLDSGKLATADAIRIAIGSATIDAASTNESALASKITVGSGNTLTVINYLDSDLSGLTNSGGSIVINTADGASLTDAKLADATAVNITTGTATITATLLSALENENLTLSSTATYNIRDTAAHLASSADQLLSGAGTVTATTAATASQANTLAGFTTPVAYSITDSASALAAATPDALNEAVNITATGTASAAQTGILLAAQNTGSTTISAASMTSAEAVALNFNATGDDKIISLSISDAATVGQATALQNLLSNADVTTLSITALTDTADNVAVISAEVLANFGGTGTVTANAYTSQDLTNIVTPILQVNTADGAQLDSSKLAVADFIQITAGIATIDAASTDELALASKITVASGNTLSVNNYLDTDLSALVNSGGSIVINTADGASLTDAKLTDVTAVNITTGTATITSTFLSTLDTANLTLGDTAFLEIRDTAANLASSTEQLLSGASTVTATSAATASQASTLASFTTPVSYNITDTASALVAATPGALNEAVNITASGTATANQTATLLAAGNSGTTTIAAASMTAAEALALQFDSTGNDTISFLAINDGILPGLQTSFYTYNPANYGAEYFDSNYVRYGNPAIRNPQVGPEVLKSSNVSLGPINLGDGQGSQYTGQSDFFYISASGYFKVPGSGSYNDLVLSLVSDDGSRLKIDQDGDGVYTTVIDQYTLHSASLVSSAPLSVTAGQNIPIQLEFYEWQGGSHVSLWYSSESQGINGLTRVGGAYVPGELIPLNSLSSGPAAATGVSVDLGGASSDSLLSRPVGITASQAAELAALTDNGDVTTLTLSGITDTAANIATITSSVLQNVTGLVTATTYHSEDLRNVVSQPLQIVTVDGAQLSSEKLATADSIKIGVGGATIDAASTDESALAGRIVVGNGTTLTINNYMDSDLSGLRNAGSGSIVVNATDGAVLNSAYLADVTSLNVISGTVTGTVASIASLAANQLTISAGATFLIEDTSANLAASSDAVLSVAASVKAMTAATAAEASILAGFTKSIEYSISDSVSALTAASAGALNKAVNIIASGTATAMQAVTLLAAGNTGTTSIAAASMTASEAAALTFNSSGDDQITTLTVTDTSSVDQATALRSAQVSGDISSLTIAGLTDTAANIASIASPVLANVQGTVTATGYISQDLTNVVSQTLLVFTADGAQLDSSKLATADGITIAAGNASLDAASSDEVSLAGRITVNNGTLLTVDNYVNTNLSGLVNQGTGSILVNTTTGAVLDESKLADATSVVLGAAASVAASGLDGIGINGSRVDLNNQTLMVTGYTSEDLSGITSAGTLTVSTANGALLDASKLATVDAITIAAGTASGSASAVKQISEEKITIADGTTLNVTSYTNQELAGFTKQATGALSITTADGASLNATNLTEVTVIIIGAGIATIDVSSADALTLTNRTIVNNGATLTVNNYVNSDLSGLSNQGGGAIVVNTTSGAVLDEVKLSDATSVVLGAAATGSAAAIDGIGSNGSRINLNNQTLSVTDYTSENLSGITRAGTLNVTTAAGAVLETAKLATVDGITIGAGSASGTASDLNTLGEEKITIADGTALNVSGYTNQELSGFNKQGSAALNITTANGATLVASNLTEASSITIGAGTANGSSSDLNQIGEEKITIASGTTLNLSGYADEELAGFTRQGNGGLSITTADGALLDGAKLADASAIIIGAGSATIDAATTDVEALANKTTVTSSATLRVDNYVNSDISGLSNQAGGSIVVTTTIGAVLDEGNLANATSVVLGAAATAAAAALDGIGTNGSLIDLNNQTLSVTGYSNQNLSGITSAGTLNVTTAADAVLDASKLATADAITIAVGTVSGTADDLNAIGEERITISDGSTLTVIGYTTQELGGFLRQGNAAISITTGDGAVLVASSLSEVTSITLGAGTASASASDLNAIGEERITIADGTTLNATGYTDQELSGFVRPGSGVLNVTTADQAILRTANLSEANTITIGAGTATIDAASTDVVALANKTTVTSAGTLRVDNYVNSDISGLSNSAGGSIVVTTTIGAVLDEGKLADATSVVLGAAATAAATALDGIGTNGSRIDLNNQTLSVTGYTNQNLSGITSAGTMNVSTAAGAVLDSSKLAAADVITIAVGSATINAATSDGTLLASRTTVTNDSMLTINGYTDADLSGLINQGSGTIVVNTITGAVLDESKLSPVSTVVLGGAATGSAAAVDGIGSNGSRIDLNGQKLTLSGYTTQDLSGVITSKASESKVWSRLQGTSSNDGARAGVVTGSDGSIYVGGYTEGSMGGQPQFGGQDGYVTKYSADGTVAWTRQIGTGSNEIPLAMAPGVDGSIYLASNNFLNIDGQTNRGGMDAMLVKYNKGGVAYDVNPVQTLVISHDPSVNTQSTPSSASSIALDQDVWYKFVVSGTWTPDRAYAPGAWVADAAYVSRNNWSTATDLDAQWFNSDFGLRSNLLGGGNDDFWGQYNPSHIYQYEFKGTGQAADFRVVDNLQPNADDMGRLDIKIYRQSADPQNTLNLGAEGTKAWTRLFGTSNWERPSALATAPDGSVYMGGTATGSIDGQTYKGNDDIFLTKYNAEGTKVWTRLLGTSDIETVEDAIVGSDGSIYVAGATHGALGNQTKNAWNDAYITKFTPDGTNSWTRLVGGFGSESANAIKQAIDGSIYIAGSTSATTLDGQPNAGSDDAFISKFNPDGTKVWTRVFGTIASDVATSLTTGSDGSIYIGGYSKGNMDGQSNRGNNDGFVSKFNPDGTRSWTSTFGSSGDDHVLGITIDSTGALYISGDTAGNYEGLTNTGGYDSFLSKLNTTAIGTLELITAEGAVLDATKLAKVDAITIGSGSARLDASLTDEVALASKITVGTGAALTVDNYVDTDLSKLTNNGGSIAVNTAAGAVLDDAKLVDVSAINISSGSASSTATLLTGLGANRLSVADGASLNIVDTVVNIVASNNAVLDLATTVTATTIANAAQAATLASFSKPVVYTISDTASALAAAPSAALNEAVNINASGTASSSATFTLLAATNSGTTTLSAASMTAAEALSLQFDTTGNDTLLSLTITDGGNSSETTTVSQALALSNLKANGDISGLSIVGITDIAANIAPISAAVLSNVTGVVTATSYQTEDLSNVVNQTLLVVTAADAQLDSTKLATADGITIGAGTTRMDAATSDEVSLAAKTTVTSGATLIVDNYVDTNLASLTNNGGSVVVNTVSGAVLDETKLSKATSVVLGAAATGAAAAIDGIGTNGSRIDLNNQTLNVSGYTNQNLSGISSPGSLYVATATGAVLDSSKLATVDAITIAAGSATLDAATNDEVVLIAKTTVNNGTTLTINNYTDTDLRPLANQGSGTIVVSTAIGAVLDEIKLSPASTVVLGAAATGTAEAVDGIGSNGSRIDLNGQTLTLTGYTNQDLSGVIDVKGSLSQSWSRLQGTTNNDGGTAGVVTGSDGSIFVGGYTEGNMGGQPLFGGQDPYVTKYTPDGAIVWTRQIGTASNEMSWSMAADVDGSVYIASNNALNIDGQVNAGSWDAMLAKYNSDGTKAWTRLLGSSAAEMPGAIATAQ